MACINTSLVFEKARQLSRKGTEDKAGDIFMALRKPVVSLHHKHCGRLCFLLLRKEMLGLEEDNRGAQLSGFVSLERNN